MLTGELFTRYEGNPILTKDNWPYLIGSVFNAGAVKFKEKTILLIRVEDRRGFSHLSRAVSDDGKAGWVIDETPTLEPMSIHDEAEFGIEDPRIVWVEEFKKHIIACVSFCAGVENAPPSISLISTYDFSSFTRIARLAPPNKNGALFPKKIGGRFAMIHRPSINGRSDVWVSFSKDLAHWGDNRVLLQTRKRMWDEHRVGIGPPPIEVDEGWLIIYHGARETASGSLYRVGLALLDKETLRLTHRVPEWVLSPETGYEVTGFVDGVIFPCGAVIEEGELRLYYGAADSVLALATASMKEVLAYLKQSPI